VPVPIGTLYRNEVMRVIILGEQELVGSCPTSYLILAQSPGHGLNFVPGISKLGCYRGPDVPPESIKRVYSQHLACSMRGYIWMNGTLSVGGGDGWGKDIYLS